VNGKGTLVPVRSPHPAWVTVGPGREAAVELGYGGGGRELAGTVTLATDGTAASAIALRWAGTGKPLTAEEAAAAIGVAARCAESARATAGAFGELPGDGEPEQRGGLRLVPSAGPAVHTPEPEPGSFRAADGRRTALSRARYPVRAVCRTCQQGIRSDGYFLPFEHDGGETAGEDGDEPAGAPGLAPDEQGSPAAATSRERHSSCAEFRRRTWEQR
jgi:hypothetical protein